MSERFMGGQHLGPGGEPHSHTVANCTGTQQRQKQQKRSMQAAQWAARARQGAQGSAAKR